MPFTFSHSREFQSQLEKFLKKEPSFRATVNRKISEIVESDLGGLQRFKTLSGEFKGFQRIHIGPRVMIFQVKKDENHIIFRRIAHHDDAYK